MKNPLSGLKNFGNTCFIDTIMLALFHLPPFIKYLIQTDYTTPLLQETKNLHSRLIVHGYSESSDVDKATKDLSECKKIDFLKNVLSSDYGYRQPQDYSEFLDAFLNHVNKEIFEIKNHDKYYNSTLTVNSDKTDFHLLYNLNMIQQKNCIYGHSLQTLLDESLIQLPLPISETSLDFTILLKSHFQKEGIQNSYCTQIIHKTLCNKRIHSRLRLNHPPQILIIQLKRYYFNDFAQKNDVNVSIEFELLTDCFNNEYITYELVSIICHAGEDLNSGHYTCYCKENDDNWYFFDDLRAVTFADLSSTDTDDYRKCLSESYVLFYGYSP